MTESGSSHFRYFDRVSLSTIACSVPSRFRCPRTVEEAALRAVCERYGVARLDVFGSVARGEAGPGSDIDLIYELAPGQLLGWEIEDLADELAGLLGAPVDLVSRRSLQRRLQDAALREARPLYAAA